VACTFAHSASGATSNEVLKTSRAAHAVRINVSQETRKVNVSVHDQSDGEDQFHHLSPLRPLQFQVAEGSNNLYDSTGIPNVDEGITLIDNSSKIL